MLEKYQQNSRRFRISLPLYPYMCINMYVLLTESSFPRLSKTVAVINKVVTVKKLFMNRTLQSFVFTQFANENLLKCSQTTLC
jgi:hypothetical protein